MIKSPIQLKKADDLFEKSSMSFGDHLEALRKSLIWTFIWLGIGMAIGLPMANWAIRYIQTPLEASLEEFYDRQTIRDIEAKTGDKVSTDLAAWIKKNKLYQQVIAVDVDDLNAAISAEETPKSVDAVRDSEKIMSSVDRMRWIKTFIPIRTNTDALGLQEPFMIWLKAGFVLGFVIASPGIFYALWTFVAAGLYPHERRYVYLFLPMSVGLFVGGAALAFFVIFRFVIDFLLKFNESMGINASPRLTDYMSFAVILPLGFGIAFQLPLVMLVLERIGILSTKLYLSQWRSAILIIAFLSMILTPAEPMSMIGMCIPLVGLYFLGILLCLWMPRGGSPHKGFDPK
ncbi:MAG: twin-arginine translocase subunit TatC [Pirellulaceae bacterium]|nr:twin-arginine translocase subunit TatC [Pirellulaceae bacterium]